MTLRLFEEITAGDKPVAQLIGVRVGQRYA